MRRQVRWVRSGACALTIASTLVIGLAAQNAGQAQQPANAPNQGHEGEYTREQIEAGAKLFGANCTGCHGANGDSIAGVDLASGKFRSGSSDEDVIRVLTVGIPGTAMRPLRLDRGEQLSVIAYIRNMRDFGRKTVASGDRARGQAIAEGKGRCMSCHRVNAVGGRVGPDLSGVGALRSGEVLQQTLIDPNAALLPMNRSVRAVKKDGTVVTGLRLNEDTYSVQLLDDKEQLVSLLKGDLREYVVLTTSRMPSYRETLTSGEVADVVAYLLSLRVP